MKTVAKQRDNNFFKGLSFGPSLFSGDIGFTDKRRGYILIS
jgi:hypothetical protein